MKNRGKKDPSPRMLAANNPPAINVTQLKSSSEQDVDGSSRVSYSHRGDKHRILPLKLDRAASKIEKHNKEGDMSLLSPIVKTKRSASNHHRTKTFHKRPGANDLLSSEPKIREDPGSYRSSISLKSNKKSSHSN
jgi:hypothetical protein